MDIQTPPAPIILDRPELALRVRRPLSPALASVYGADELVLDILARAGMRVLRGRVEPRRAVRQVEVRA